MFCDMSCISADRKGRSGARKMHWYLGLSTIIHLISSAFNTARPAMIGLKPFFEILRWSKLHLGVVDSRAVLFTVFGYL